MAAEEDEPTEGTQREHPVVIDAGMRRWYESCPCCMGAAYPEVKRRLDEERWAEG